MQRHDPQVREQQLIRESAASVAYHHPDYVTYAEDLRAVLKDATPKNWLLAGKILKHMNNYHRKKFLKMRPEIFADLDLFNLMMCAYIPEDDIAELAIKRIPMLRNDQEYRKLLSIIPDKNLKKFMIRANEMLPYTDKSTPADPSSTHETVMKNQSYWHPVALIAAFSAAYLCRKNFALAWPILSCLCAIYFSHKRSQHPPKQVPAFASLWAPAEKNEEITAEYHHMNCLLQ